MAEAITTMGTTTIAMDTPSHRLGSSRPRMAYTFTRALTWLVAITAIAWGGFFLPQLWRQAPLDHVASEYLRGQGFKSETLYKMVREAEMAKQLPFCDPTWLRDMLILRLAILNDAIAEGDGARTKLDYAPLYVATRTALSCTPSNSFAWLVLFWLDVSRRGLNPDSAHYLRLSYTLSCNEEWIALWRNSLALSIFPQLPTDLADDAVDEFIELVNTEQLYSQTVKIFAGLPPATQDRIVAKIGAVKAVPRQIFARMLYDDGIDVAIPGFRKPERPWQ